MRMAKLFLDLRKAATFSAWWWTLTIISVTPKDFRRSMVISRRVRPLSSTRALGMLSVRGRRRGPRPAARIMAFIGKDHERRGEGGGGAGGSGPTRKGETKTAKPTWG